MLTLPLVCLLSQAISNGLTLALSLRLLMGGGGGGAAAAALTRCGAAAFGSEVDALAADLGRVAAISEAVHSEAYEALAGSWNE